jgi:hypothetical protein
MMFRHLTVWLLVSMVSCAIAGAATNREIEVRTLTGATVKPLDMPGRLATVLLFVTHDCPISNAYAPEFTRICKQYSAHKIGFDVVYVEADLSAPAARQHAHDYGYLCPALLDPAHRLVKLAGATVTPEAAVFTPDGKRVYLGRIDNQYAALGQRRQVVTVHDLRAVLDHIIAGKPVSPAETTAIGCFIPPLK